MVRGCVVNVSTSLIAGGLGLKAAETSLKQKWKLLSLCKMSKMQRINYVNGNMCAWCLLWDASDSCFSDRMSCWWLFMILCLMDRTLCFRNFFPLLGKRFWSVSWLNFQWFFSLLCNSFRTRLFIFFARTGSYIYHHAVLELAEASMCACQPVACRGCGSSWLLDSVGNTLMFEYVPSHHRASEKGKAKLILG